MRLDLLLYRLRLVRSRSKAKTLVESGHVRIDGRRVQRANALVSAGDTLTFPIGRGVCVLRILALPERRGPATEAQQCYERL